MFVTLVKITFPQISNFGVRGEAEKIISGKVSTCCGVRACDRWHQVLGA